MAGQPASFSDTLGRVYWAAEDAINEQAARALGADLDARSLSEEEELERWSFRDPAMPPERVQQVVAAMLAQGRTLEDGLLDEVNNLIYPYRRDVYTRGTVGIKRQVQKAKRLAVKATARREADDD